MSKIVFSINLETKEVILANNFFKKQFPKINALPYKYKNSECVKEIVKKAKKSLVHTDLSSLVIKINNIKYSFDIDKVDSTLIFTGQELISKNNILNTKAHDLLRLLSDNLPDMLWAKDINGHYLFANQAICDNLLMAESTSEPVGKTDVFFALREREKHNEKKNWHTFGELCFDSDKVVLEHMKPMRFEEYGNVKGKLLYLEVHKAPFFDDEGRLLGTIGSGRDITSEILAKKELKEKDKLMAQQSKMAAMGEMIGNIAHQWRQPLSMISSLATTTIVEKQLNLLSDDQLAEKLRSIQETTIHLSNTIDDFRLFFKPNKEKVSFNLDDTINKTLHLLKPKFKANHIHIIKSIDTNIEITALENELIQVLMNILGNAKDALMQHELDKKLLFIKLRKDDSKITIKIKDNAKGIDPEILHRIFEPYFTTKHKSQGTGIGLYMSEVIVVKHLSGTIDVKNCEFIHDKKRYTGAQFKITIPLN